MKHNITTVAFDADDTLWANEDLFVAAQARYTALLAPYRHDWDAQELHATEQRNLAYFGYGIKGFTLSMIETAIQISDGAVTGHEVAQIIDLAREMVHAPLTLLPQVADVIPALAQTHRLMLITKGLADYFRHIEVVSEKNSSTYARILRRHDINPSEFVMIGNSLRSDILPVVALGAHAIHVPYHLTWQHEHVDVPSSERTWREMTDITAVASWLAQNY